MNLKRRSSTVKLKRKAGSLPAGVSRSKRTRIWGRNLPKHTGQSDPDVSILHGQRLLSATNRRRSNKPGTLPDNDKARDTDAGKSPQGATHCPDLFEEEADDMAENENRPRSQGKPPALFDDDEDSIADLTSPRRRPSKIQVMLSDEEQDGKADDTSGLRRPAKLPVLFSDKEEDGSDDDVTRTRRASKGPISTSDEDVEPGEGYGQRSALNLPLSPNSRGYDNGDSHAPRRRGSRTRSDPEEVETVSQGYAAPGSRHVRRLIEMEAQGGGGGCDDEEEEEEDDNDDGRIDDDEPLQRHERGAMSRDEYGGAGQQAKVTNAMPTSDEMAASDEMEAALLALETSYERSLSKRRETLGVRRRLSSSELHLARVPADNVPTFQATRAHVLSDDEKAEAAWIEYLGQLPTDFFSAQNLFVSRTERNEPSGAPSRMAFVNALAVNENNNLDMSMICAQRCHNRRDPGKLETYRNTRSVVGQYSRVYLTFNPEARETFFEQGSLFAALRNSRLLNLFLNKYKVDASPTTVTTKANHLVAAARVALRFYSSTNKPVEKGEIVAIISQLQNISSTCRSADRSERRIQRALESRLNLAKQHLLSMDYDNCINLAEKQLIAVMNALEGRHMPSQSPVQLARHRKTLDKWFLNLTALIIFATGGHSPQVYGNLRAPEKTYLLRVEQDPERRYVELHLDVDMFCQGPLPSLLIPKSIIKYIHFHIDQMLPWLKKVHGMDLDQGPGRFLLHTETGEGLSSSQIARTLRVFVSGYDKELSMITPVILRGSYIVIMIERHQRGEVLADKTEVAFLDFLTKYLNTSRDQLEATYAAAKTRDCSDVTRELISGLIRDESEARESLHPMSSFENRVSVGSSAYGRCNDANRRPVARNGLSLMWS